MSKYKRLSLAGFADKSMRGTFPWGGYDWITDTYTIARADVCSTRANVPACETPERARSQMRRLMRTDAPIVGLRISEGPYHRSTAIVGGPHFRMGLPKAQWDAWSVAANPFLGGIGDRPVIVWARDRAIVGISGPRRFGEWELI